MEKNKLASKVMEELVERAASLKYLTGTRPGPYSKPGELIQSLGPVKRHILEGLKSEDISDIRSDPFIS